MGYPAHLEPNRLALAAQFIYTYMGRPACRQPNNWAYISCPAVEPIRQDWPSITLQAQQFLAYWQLGACSSFNGGNASPAYGVGLFMAQSLKITNGLTLGFEGLGLLDRDESPRG